MFVYCGSLFVLWCLCRNQRTTFGSQMFFPFIMWVLGLELRGYPAWHQCFYLLRHLATPKVYIARTNLLRQFCPTSLTVLWKSQHSQLIYNFLMCDPQVSCQRTENHLHKQDFHLFSVSVTAWLKSLGPFYQVSSYSLGDEWHPLWTGFILYEICVLSSFCFMIKNLREELKD